MSSGPITDASDRQERPVRGTEAWARMTRTLRYHVPAKIGEMNQLGKAMRSKVGAVKR